MDALVRRVMREACSLHPRSAIERVYLPHQQGGRGLLNIEDLYHRRVILLSQHLQTSADALVRMCYVVDCSLPASRSIITRANNFLKTMSLTIQLTSVTCDELRGTVCAHQRQCHLEHLNDKPLHGKFYSWCFAGSVDPLRSFHWLNQYLHSESESTILAIQDQVLHTRVYEAKIMKQAVPSLMCRLCSQKEETIQHLLAGCSTLAATSYVSRHNLVARVLHWHLSHTFGLPAAISWFSHHPVPVVENSRVKILWDFGMHTVSPIACNRPDLTVFIKGDANYILLLEVSCPADVNIVEKEGEKIAKYQPLVRQLMQLHGQPVEVVPVVLGVTGVVSRQQKDYLKKVPAYSDSLFANLQKAVIIGTIFVLRDINL